MYNPHDLARTPQAIALVEALRDADAVIVGSPGYHGAISGLVKNALDYMEDMRTDPRVYLDNKPWGCISCAYGWQAAVGTLGQLRGIGHALRAWPTPIGVAINSADKIWDDTGAVLTDPLGYAASSKCSPPRCSPSPARAMGAQRERIERGGRSLGRRARHRHILEAGSGEPVVLLHGGEFGASAEFGWEHTIDALAQRYHVIAPDMLGFGESAKVIDFTDGRGMRIRHIARLCALLGIESAYFIGNSMGAVNLLADTTAENPALPVRAMVTICGGGQIRAGEHMQALYDFDATLPAMRRIVTALFSSPVVSGRRGLCTPAVRIGNRPRRLGGDRGGSVPAARC